IVGKQPELRLPIVFRRAQPAVLRGLHVALCQFLIAARLVEIGDAFPLLVPALLVAGLHPAGGQEAFRNRATALRHLAERAPELVAHPGMLRPMMPAKRLVVRIRAVGNLVDQELFRHAILRSVGSASAYSGSSRLINHTTIG